MRAWTLFSFLLMLICGCTVNRHGPDLDGRFSADLPSGWKSLLIEDVDPAVTLESLTKDEGLRSKIIAVLEGNPSLERAALNLKSTGVLATRGERALEPTLTLLGDAQRAKSEGNQPRTTSHTATLTFAWELDVWSRLADAGEAAEYDHTAAEADLRAARSSLIAQTMTNWVRMGGQSARIRLQQTRIASLRKTEDVVADRFRRGVGSLDDLEAARAATAAAEADLITRQQAYRSLRRQMDVLAGDFPTDEAEAPNEIVDIDLPRPETPLQAIGRRADVASAFVTGLAAGKRADVAYKDLLPRFSLSATLSEAAGSPSATFQGGPAWTLLANLTAPLLDGGARRAALSQAEITEARTWLLYRESLLNAVLEVENTLSEEHTQADREAALARSYAHARESYQLFQRRYAEGLADIVTLLQAERTVFDARDAWLLTRQARMENRIALGQALGLSQ